jgi:hypothetical protein
MMGQRFARALARHLHQAELRETAGHGLDAVTRELLAELRQHGLAMVFAHHVDEIGNDDPPQIAQPQLPRDGLRGFEIGLEDGFVETAYAPTKPPVLTSTVVSASVCSTIR